MIRGAQYQEPVLVAKIPEYPSLCVWRGVELGFDIAGLIEQNGPLAIKREPSVREIVGPLRAPSTPVPQFKPAPRIIFHFLDAAGGRRRSRAIDSIPNSAALFANVRAANPHGPLDDLDTVFARVTSSEEVVPLVKRDEEDWEALMNLVEVQKGVAIAEVEIRAAL